jgi:hypothetical protein
LNELRLINHEVFRCFPQTYLETAIDINDQFDEPDWQSEWPWGQGSRPFPKPFLRVFRANQFQILVRQKCVLGHFVKFTANVSALQLFSCFRQNSAFARVIAEIVLLAKQAVPLNNR